MANRVAAIQDEPSSSQWKRDSTKQDTADDASRGLSTDAFLKNESWFKGPDFLWKTEDAWPNQQLAVSTVTEEDPEIKKEPKVFGKNAEDLKVTTVDKLTNGSL